LQRYTIMNTFLLSLILTVSIQAQRVEYVNQDFKAMHELASMLEGEAGTCSTVGMVAVANVHSRNQTMYARAEPSGEAIRVAALAMSGRIPEITGGATHVFSLSDLRLERVKRIIKGNKPLAMIYCNNGKMALNFY